MHLVCPGQHIQYLQQDTVGPVYSSSGVQSANTFIPQHTGCRHIHPAASIQEVPTYPLSSKQETTYLFGSKPWYNISIQKDIIELTYLPNSIRGGATYLSSRKQSGEHIYFSSMQRGQNIYPPVYRGAYIFIQQ
jgi:hypothetical protein